ncbi:MAG: hypothetical protein Q9227_002867 [Pyrenula ochraceoflavens]
MERHGTQYAYSFPLKIWRYVDHIKKAGIAEVGSIKPIPAAKVPIIKFVDRLTGLNVDLSFNNSSGYVANETYEKWKLAYPALMPIIAILKQYLMIRGLNDVSIGGLGGFSLTCLVTSLIQHLPFESNPPNLGRVLIEFFNLYGKHFDYRRHGIRMEPPGYFHKVRSWSRFDSRVLTAHSQDVERDRLAISDPNRSDNDISGGTSAIGLIFDTFSDAYDLLEEGLDDYNLGISTNGSLLGDSIAGNYAPFENQRNRLRNLYNKEHRATIGRDQTTAIAAEQTSPNSGKSHRRAWRLRTLRPDIPNVPGTITMMQAVKIGGYKSQEEMMKDLESRERAANATKK